MILDPSGNKLRILIVRRGATEISLEIPAGRLGVNIAMAPAAGLSQ